MTTQIAVKLPDSVVLEMDALVDDGRFARRSDAVRLGLSLMIERSRADFVDRSFVDGFTRQPQRAEELDDARRWPSKPYMTSRERSGGSSRGGLVGVESPGWVHRDRRDDHSCAVAAATLDC